ncbi:hypothetical protein FOTG_15832 [Fusarium oxysporum f. sp. vasinfectum 25433]|uniref:HAT C-terminal dimerisation domain-containing protein n=1 Tax=Fusarium oxysporum f. sp. vasinfectum 25433 TaxID=1089449 RepID=X0L485_FUSOX|nr:hypothetical protein FOTG_15832 [Fusarium oxysporum f. sp. vasinfectum 25433]
MATCFLNNVYCCYLPAHCSHGLQPLDNGVFNASKAAYRRELEKFASLTDSAPMDKVNFIRAYAKARRVGMTKKNILSGWRVTGNWPISRAKALRHPEIQQDGPNGSPRVTPEPRPYLGSDDTPQTSRQIRDLGLNKTPKTRRRYNVIAKGFEAQQQTVAAHTQRIASLEEELARLKRGKKRKAVPNPNKRFMTLGETLASKECIPQGATRYMPVRVEFVSSSKQESESEAGSVIEIKQFLLDYDKEINDNILNSSDWDYLERTHRFLHPFASATLWAEGKNSTLSQILTIMDGLLRHYEKNKEHYSKPETFDRRILHSIEMGWFILDKYYTMTEDAPVYAAALLLDPSKRIMYIQRHWPESWHGNAIAGVHTIWEEEYKTQPETGPAESVDEVSASQKRQPNEWDALLEELEVTEDLGDSMDDLEDFIKATPIKISGSPLQWWCHKDQRKTYPQLSRMAIDILSIAPESADPESAFSGGRRTLSWDRERMTCENLEKVECIGNWLREGHIQKTVHGGMGVITDTGFDSGGGEDSDVNFD